jgi:SAM-dependent methyltransferase
MSGSNHPAVRQRFSSEAHRWDEIYGGDGGPVARLWDRATRANVRLRFERTFARAGDLRGRTVLDLGCGSGRYLVEAAHRGAARVVGVDVAPEMIEVARRLTTGATADTRVELVCADFGALALDEAFDLVIANGVYDYLDDARTHLTRARHWTRGLLVATFPDRRAPRALPRSLYWRLRGIRIQLFDPRSIGELANDAGFRDFEIEKIGPIYLLAARSG